MSLAASRWTDSRLAVAATLVVACLGLLTLWSGVLAPVDQSLREARFSSIDRPPSGDTVFLEIDATSLRTVGVWPWPRQVHADILDRLMALGSAEVLFDIDFSSASTPEGDAAFEQALERAGGYAFLAAFQQLSADGRTVLNRPIPRFGAHAASVLVNVDGDGTRLLRSVPAGLADPYILSVARTLAPGATSDTPEIGIDFGIDLKAITRISASELLRGNADPALFAGKQVIVGASAIAIALAGVAVAVTAAIAVALAGVAVAVTAAPVIALAIVAVPVPSTIAIVLAIVAVTVSATIAIALAAAIALVAVAVPTTIAIALAGNSVAVPTASVIAIAVCTGPGLHWLSATIGGRVRCSVHDAQAIERKHCDGTAASDQQRFGR